MPGHGTPSRYVLVTNGSRLIDLTSLFSAPEGAPRRATAASPSPATNPFKIPDSEGNEAALPKDAQASVPGTDPAPTVG